ncbi:uncharacterized protein [Anabrus simplex]|uniref:uncharacterized protein isoform X2 n=1 Tax=Anabrus simplex TaxID=316456 RepID=UPI0034DCEFA7
MEGNVSVKPDLIRSSHEGTMESPAKEENAYEEEYISIMEPELIIKAEETGQREVPLTTRTRCRCSLCPRKRDKKASLTCYKCNNVCCRQHLVNICTECYKDS